jgi:hypothetical protein
LAQAAALALALALALGGCERGCAREWLAERGLGAPGPSSPGPMPLYAVDCPDGLAQCDEGAVSASRLATVPMPCRGPANDCTCPWEPAGACASGCVAEGVEVVVEKGLAARQLCASGRDAGVFALPMSSAVGAGGATPNADAACDEGDRYRCSGGHVVECATSMVVARCLRGCFAEGTSIDDDAVSREAAFAILCSR